MRNTFTIKLIKDTKSGLWVLLSVSPLTFGYTSYLPLCPYCYFASGDAYPKKKTQAIMEFMSIEVVSCNKESIEYVSNEKRYRKFNMKQNSIASCLFY